MPRRNRRRRRQRRRWWVAVAVVIGLVVVLPIAVREGRLAYVDWKVDHHAEAIRAHAAAAGLDYELVRAVVEIESGGDPYARSKAGAVGLMQVMPVTERDVLERNPELARGRLTDPDYNLRVGTTYLSYLLERFDGDLKLALAAYHMGPTKVAKAKQGDPGLTTDELIAKHAGPKTRAYVRNVLRAMGAESDR